ncbi:hypothetical protein KD050_06125 [Psychrobacillus sp. INOP01]|uniref:hypothetical protein n=1 Tax=Psychrobacillus sp. INOP01 TaxID=2829187 RepID=UPI001BA56170|nr:hypothetical protein [Psychrobacillus sp. INOP01]QUG42823.1 hypothetical protein KD050_06125 [Psychrobacillus sp. INOP01]
MKLTIETKFRNLLICLLIIAFGIVTYSLDLYPGGYQLDYYSEAQSFTLTKKDILHSEQYKIDKTEISMLKVLLIDNEITVIKSLWLLSIMLFCTWLNNLFILLEQEKIKPALLISAIYVVIFVVATFVYIDRLNFMNEVIGRLVV